MITVLHILFFYKFFLNSMFFHLHMNSMFIRPSTLIREVRRVPKWVFYNFHPITYVLSMRSWKRLWCTLAGPALAIAECLLDESADYFISGQILELQLEILRVHLISREIKHYRAMDKKRERFNMSKYKMCDTIWINSKPFFGLVCWPKKCTH